MALFYKTNKMKTINELKKEKEEIILELEKIDSQINELETLDYIEKVKNELWFKGVKLPHYAMIHNTAVVLQTRTINNETKLVYYRPCWQWAVWIKIINWNEARTDSSHSQFNNLELKEITREEFLFDNWITWQYSF